MSPLRKLQRWLEMGGWFCVGGVLCLLMVGSIFAGAFVQPLTVHNASGQPLRLVAVAVNEGGGLGPAHLVEGAGVFTCAASPSALRLEPGASARLQYDMDDMNFCWLVVLGKEYRVLNTGLPPGNCPESLAEHKGRVPCCQGLPVDSLTVPFLDTLPLAPEEVAAVARKYDPGP